MKTFEQWLRDAVIAPSAPQAAAMAPGTTPSLQQPGMPQTPGVAPKPLQQPGMPQAPGAAPNSTVAQKPGMSPLVTGRIGQAANGLSQAIASVTDPNAKKNLSVTAAPLLQQISQL